MKMDRGQIRLLPADHQTGPMPLAWLLFLMIFFIDPAVRWREGLLTIPYTLTISLTTVLFLLSYFRGFWAKGGELILIIGLQALLGTVLTPLNPGAAVFFTYATSFAGMVERRGLTIALIIGVTTTAALTAYLISAPPHFWAPAVGLPALIGFVNLQAAQAREADAQLRLAYDQIEHLAAIAERERIARDLHDLLGHTLSLITLKSELARKLLDHSPERAATEVQEIEGVARRALHEVREAISGYRAKLHDEIEQSRLLLEAAGIESAFTVDLEIERIGRATEETLALALREGVTNVARHSRARSCQVHLLERDHHYLLEIEDDGIGGEVIEGNGLSGMRERVEVIGGSIDLSTDTRNGRGLRLAISLTATTHPLNATARGIQR